MNQIINTYSKSRAVRTADGMKKKKLFVFTSVRPVRLVQYRSRVRRPRRPVWIRPIIININHNIIINHGLLLNFKRIGLRIELRL